jgi:DNA processing protein
MDLADLLILKSIPGIGDATVRKIFDEFKFLSISSIDSDKACEILFSKAYVRFHNVFRELLPPHTLKQRRLVTNLSIKTIEENNGTEIIGLSDTRYPRSLMRLNDAPCVLYARGNIGLLQNQATIAVVGTRDPTALGKKIATKTTEYFSQNGIVIVSGLALGIDTQAHAACLASNGHTVAVLTDIDIIAPSSNRSLAHNIINNHGLLLSENPPNTKVVPAHFIKRDRIQSALSKAVFVIESSKGGGSMHAAGVAKKLNIPTYVPDPVQAGYPAGIKQTEGTIELLSNGDAKSYSRESYLEILSILTSPKPTATEYLTNSERSLF